MRAAWVLVAGLLLGCPKKPEVNATDRSDGQIPIYVVTRGGRASLAAARSMGGFVNPGTGQVMPDSPVQGDAAMTWDAVGLHVRVDVHDPNPIAPFDPAVRDPHVWERSTGVELMLEPDAAGDNHGYFEIQVDRRRAVWSTRFDAYNQPITEDDAGVRHFGHEEWQPDLQVETTDLPGGHGFRVVFTVPWASLVTNTGAHRPEHGTVWRANLYTFRDGQRHSLAWSPILGQGNFHRASRWGRIRF